MGKIPYKQALGRRAKNNSGFTIIELMIATSVFGVVLLVITLGIIQIGRTYYKGVTEAKTQNTARAIVDTIAQDIQFSGDQVNIPAAFTSPYALCVGKDRYSVRLAQKLVDGVNHVLMLDQPGTCSTGTTNFAGGSGTRELLEPNMRLVTLSICVPGMAANSACPTPPAAGSNLYQIKVRVIYGEDDLLCSPSSNPADCSNGGTSPYLNASDLTCKGQTGSEFCAVSEFTTSVQKRLT